MGNKKKVIDEILHDIGEIIESEEININNYYLVNKEDLCKICIVVDKLNQRKINITKTIRKKLFYKINYPLHIFIYTKEEFEKKSRVCGSIEYNLKKEGEFINGPTESVTC